MVKDMGLASFLVYLYISFDLEKTIAKNLKKKKQKTTYYIPVIVLYMYYTCIIESSQLKKRYLSSLSIPNNEDAKAKRAT